MVKVTYANICLSFLVKYLFFYFILGCINNDFSIFKFYELRSLEGVFLYFWLVLGFPILEVFLFSNLLFKAFHSSYRKYILLVSLVLLAQYSLFSFLTSQKLLNFEGLLNVSVQLLIISIFYDKKRF